jgi:hypothetical protein
MEAADLVFGVFWSGTFLGIFELFHDMYENGSNGPGTNIFE